MVCSPLLVNVLYDTYRMRKYNCLVYDVLIIIYLDFKKIAHTQCHLKNYLHLSRENSKICYEAVILTVIFIWESLPVYVEAEIIAYITRDRDRDRD